jgi:carotenoid cleavage dioxygenase-like enzyme
MNRAALGFKSLPCDFQVHQTINVSGLPEWLNGTLYRIGPGMWPATTSHWFLGLGFLQSFRFSQGDNHQLEYTAQFVKSDVYKESCLRNAAAFGFSPNTGVCIRRVKDKESVHLLANTGLSLSNEFDYQSLDTLQAPFEYGDEFASSILDAPSHAQTDLQGNIVHFLHATQPELQYLIYSIPYGSRTRQILGRIPQNPKFDTPVFLHSFAMTQHYVVIPEVPALFRPGGFVNFTFDPSVNTTWKVVSKETGEQVAEFTSKAFFFYHQINAYENITDNTIAVDLIGYPDMTSLYAMSLHNILNDPEALRISACANRMMRFVLPMTQKSATITPQILSEVPCTELPTIRDKTYITKPYRYAYAIAYADPLSSDFLDSLVKVDVSTGAYKRWYEPDCYPGEPIFVASPNSVSEDDGIILSLVLDVHAEKSFLLTLDAKSMEVLSKAYLPHPMPFGFHGRQYGDL